MISFFGAAVAVSDKRTDLAEARPKSAACLAAGEAWALGQFSANGAVRSAESTAHSLVSLSEPSNISSCLSISGRYDSASQTMFFG